MARRHDPIFELLASVFQQAPQGLHHVFALDGANGALAALESVASKAAYLLHMIAIELHKASKEIDLTKLSAGPNDIKFHIIRTDGFFASIPVDVTVLDLGHFEDLYYATCAKLKELLHGVDIHLTNGFKSSSDIYFTYRCPRLETLDPIKVGDFRAWLLIYEKILYSHELIELLNKGVLRKSMCDNKCDCQNQLGFAEGTVHNIGRIGCGQCNNSNQTEGRAQLRTGVFQGNSGWLTGIRGLQDTRNMSCSMIYASLAEKYRPTVLNAELAGASINRPGTPDAPQVFKIASSDQAYISPYNLEERAKKLNSPGGPEMPCICDPDCMCAPVCASDPTRNCLCEENGLFASVTQGIDIDDLDVPDLVRRNRHGSETSGSSVVSLLASIRTTPESSSNVTHHTAIEDDSDYRYVTYSEMKNQQLDRPHDLPAGIEAADTMSMSIDEMLASPDIEQFEFWDGQITRPPRVSSLSYRDALTQPFAKQCDYPPRRSSVAQRLFSSRNLATSNGVLGTGRKALKEANKRSLTDMSLTGLKFALRRASQMRDTVANN